MQSWWNPLNSRLQPDWNELSRTDFKPICIERNSKFFRIHCLNKFSSNNKDYVANIFSIYSIQKAFFINRKRQFSHGFFLSSKQYIS